MPSFAFRQSSVLSTDASSFAFAAAAAEQSLHDEELLVATAEPATTLFVDMMADLQQITSQIESVKSQVRVRRQRRAVVVAVVVAATATADAEQITSPTRGTPVTATSRPRRKTTTTQSKVKAEFDTKVQRVVTRKTSGNGPKAAIPKSERSSASSSSAANRRKKDEDALDCIYAELQASVGMCRYWGKKCWNLRVPKAKGGFHSLCHFHRVKANDNQRRFDYKRRGTLWRSFQPDPNYKDISLFPGASDPNGAEEAAVGTAAALNFEPFERPEPLQDQDVALLRELIGSATI
ncbi:hypothetical protein Gpo141_00014243 [Globisporangium polare]